jgi:streptomycin 6-kinase
VIESLITGAAIGIVGCLGGQGVMMKLQQTGSNKLAERVAELEAKELVIEGDFIGRKEVQQALDGMAQVMQQALAEQGQGLQQMIMMGQEQTAKAVRVAEARTRQMPQQQTPPPEQMAQMMEKFEALQRQIGG